jgi:hypothetical protein
MTGTLHRRQSRIVDRHGKPFSFGFLYPTTRSNPKAFKPAPWLARDTKQNFNAYDRLEMVDRSKQLYAQVPELSTAIRQKNNWAFGDGWEAHYFGPNKEWAKEAKEFLDLQVFPFCNIRGPQFNLRESMKMMGKAWDVEGDDLMVLTETESHFPQIAFFPSSRIGNWGDKTKREANGLLKEGPFKGATIHDGIILNRNNRPIAVRVLNDDGTHKDISTFNCDLGFEPEWCDQVRGIPRIGTSLLQWINLQAIDGYLQDSVKRASKMAFKIKNAEGEAPIGNEVITQEDSPTAEAFESDDTISIVGGSESDRKLHYEEVAGGGGEAWWLDSTQNEDIDYIPFANPHPNVEAFSQRIRRGSLASVGWFLEFIELGESGRAATRLLADLANQTIWDRQATALRRWKRIVGYSLAKGAKHGFISTAKDLRDFALWLPGFPKQISVDAGNDVKASIDKVKFGLSTLGIEAAKDGYHPDFIREQQEHELKEAFAMADRLHPLVASKGVAYMDVVQMIRQNNPNPVSQPPQEKAAAE